MIKRAYAKLNLGLRVLSKTPEGYHSLEMVMVPITLFDQLEVTKSDEGIQLTTSHPFVPVDHRNSVVQAYLAMKERYPINGIQVFIKKLIPMQAGLAGGSSDAAAILHAINELYDLGLSNEELAEIGLTIGADVPFCIYQQAAFVTGIGESIHFIPQNVNSHVLLVKPKKGLSTKAIFSQVDLANLVPFSNEPIKEALRLGDYKMLAQSMHNHLESIAIEVLPEINDIKETLLELGFDAAMMTGSGSTVFALTTDPTILEKGFQLFKGKRMFAFKCELK